MHEHPAPQGARALDARTLSLSLNKTDAACGCPRMPRERRDLHPVRRIDPELPDMQEAPRQRNLADAVPGKQEYAEAPRIKASCPFMSIRVHSWFSLSPLLFLWISCVSCVSWFRTCPPRHHLYSCPFVSIRGSEFFVSFVSFVVQSIRAHSCPFVV